MQTLKFLTILLAAAGELAAQTEPTRRLIVNIPARKIALVECGKVVKMYSVAVGKASTPSPSGSFHIASHVINPTYSHDGKVMRPGQSGGHALDEHRLQRLWHTRNQSSRIHRPRGFARVHSSAKSGCRRIV